MVRRSQDDETELAADAAKAEQAGQSRERLRVLTPAAERALAEAAARRAERDRQADAPPEAGGRGGPDPARYGDWEVKGRAVDF
jgi:hypothetical protein